MSRAVCLVAGHICTSVMELLFEKNLILGQLEQTQEMVQQYKEWLVEVNMKTHVSDFIIMLGYYPASQMLWRLRS